MSKKTILAGLACIGLGWAAAHFDRIASSMALTDEHERTLAQIRDDWSDQIENLNQTHQAELAKVIRMYQVEMTKQQEMFDRKLAEETQELHASLDARVEQDKRVYNTQIEQLTRHHNSSIEKLKEDYGVETKKAVEAALADQRAAYEGQLDEQKSIAENFATALEQAKRDLSTADSIHATEVEVLKAEHGDEIKRAVELTRVEMNADHVASIARLKKQNDAEVEKLKADHEREKDETLGRWQLMLDAATDEGKKLADDARTEAYKQGADSVLNDPVAVATKFQEYLVNGTIQQGPAQTSKAK